MNTQDLKTYWKSEEDKAQIHGWDFSYIAGRFEEDTNLPWDYAEIVRSYLSGNKRILDIDTGGGEFLLSLGHTANMTSATEGYRPNVKLCRDVLLPLGIDFKEASDYSNLPFEDNTFDIVINRHGSYDVNELYRIIKPNGLFITQQVGEDNDRELVELLLPDAQKPFPGMNLKEQTELFLNAGFTVLKGEEAFREMKFFDIGALVWFAKIIEWEFVDFSVDNCFENLLKAQRILENDGCVKCRTHRYMITAQKRGC